MKKLLPLLLCLLLLTGCSTPPDIEEYAWQMTTIQQASDGAIIYTAPDGIVGVPQLMLTCMAEGGTIVLRDETSGMTWSGTYRPEAGSGGAARYAVVLDGADGAATTARTTWADGTEKSALIIVLRGYVLNFQSE